MGELGAEQPRHEKVDDDVPDRVVGFGAVVRVLFGHALAVARRAAAVDANDDEMFLVDAAEAGFEEVDERELQKSQLEAIDLHVWSAGPPPRSR
jgi:hypothetical protein